jgi:hypothetical protein
MTEDAPYELPGPSVVADLCALQAWKDEVDDESRLLLEMSADTIRLLMARCIKLAQALERKEVRA